MAIIKNLEVTSVGEDVKKRETLCTVGGNINKTTVRYHLTPVLLEWLLSINQQTTNVGKIVEKRDPSCTVIGNADW